MKHLLSIFVAFFIILSAANSQNTVNYETRIIGGKQYIIYHIKTGDTWASIAEKLGVAERVLIDENKQANGSLKGVNTLKVLLEKSSKSTSSVIIKNKVIEAPIELNSLPKIGEYDEVKKEEVLKNDFGVKPKIYGQELRIEYKGTNSLAVYRIGNGDNINDLAKYYNCTIDEILLQNNLTNNSLTIGKILKIPFHAQTNEEIVTVTKSTVLATDESKKTLTETPVNIEEKKILKAEISNKVDPIVKDEISINTTTTTNYVTRTIRGKEYIIYSVNANDSWKSIAAKFGVTENQLKTDNLQTNGILKGAKSLKIATDKSTISLSSNKISHKVIEAPVELNSLPKFGEEETTIKPKNDKPKIFGKELKTEFKGNKTLTVYKVGNGDDINTLAQYFNCSVSDIKSQNNLVSNSLPVGKILKILGKNSELGSSTLTEAEKLKAKYIEENTEVEAKEVSNNSNVEVKSDVGETKLNTNETAVGEYIIVKKQGKFFIKHMVISGEDLTRISKENYTPFSKIVSANNLKTTKLTVGQILLVPTTKQLITKITGLNYDEVIRNNKLQYLTENTNASNNNNRLSNQQNNDVNDSIKKYNWGDPIPEKTNILDLNAQKTADNLSKKFNLKDLHANSNSGETKVTYTHSVLEGETIEYIANKYKISTSDISNWNNLYQNRIRVGQDLIVNLDRARKPYLSINSVSPESIIQIKHLDKSDRVKYIEEKGLCLVSDDNFIGIAHKNVPVGTLLLLTSTENYKKIYVRVTSILENTNPDIILQVDKVVARQLSFNSNLTNISLSYGLVE